MFKAIIIDKDEAGFRASLVTIAGRQRSGARKPFLSITKMALQLRVEAKFFAYSQWGPELIWPVLLKRPVTLPIGVAMQCL
jgi:hypothetical protein